MTWGSHDHLREATSKANKQIVRTYSYESFVITPSIIVSTDANWGERDRSQKEKSEREDLIIKVNFPLKLKETMVSLAGRLTEQGGVPGRDTVTRPQMPKQHHF